MMNTNKTTQNQALKAVIYTRVSTEDQADNGTSLASQLLACLQKAEKIGAQVVRHHEDAGVSGARFETRPGIQAALRDVEEGRADTLIVYTMSRLSRDREHQSIIRRRIEAARGRLIFCDMDADNTPAGNLLANITGDFAEYERQVIRERVMKGRRRRAEDGLQPCRAPGMQPFGYRIPTKIDVMNGRATLEEVGKYMVREDQAPWARGVFVRYAGGASIHELCRWFEQNNIPTQRGGQLWRPSTIKRMIENPVYKGSAAFGRLRTEHDEGLIQKGLTRTFRLVANDPEDWVTLDAPPLVDMATWELCNERMKTARAVMGGRPDRKHLLSGLLVCPLCRRKMCGSRRERTQKSGFISKEHHYHCRDARPSRNAAGKVCNPVYLNGSQVEAAVLNAVREVARRPELTEAALLAYRIEDNQRDATAERDAAKNALEELTSRERATVEAQIRGIQAGADPALYAAVFAEIASKRKAAAARLAEAEAACVVAPSVEEVKDTARILAEAFADVEEALMAPELTAAEKHDLLARVIKDIEPEGDGFTLRLRPFHTDGDGNNGGGGGGVDAVTVANVRIL